MRRPYERGRDVGSRRAASERVVTGPPRPNPNHEEGRVIIDRSMKIAAELECRTGHRFHRVESTLRNHGFESTEGREAPGRVLAEDEEIGGCANLDHTEHWHAKGFSGT